MTLTEAAYWTRRLGIILIALFAMLIIIVLVISNIKEDNTPPEYAKPNYACTDTAEEFLQNKLSIPSIELASGSEKIFEIDTETGKADQLPQIVNVYKYDNPGQLLNSQNEAKKIAKSLGFNPELISRTTNEYYWNDSTTSRELRIQARNLNLTMKTDYTKPNGKLPDGALPTESQASSIASNFLRNAGLLTDDYANEKPLTKYITLEPDGSYSEANSVGEADLIRVDFIRKTPIITIRSDWEGADQMKTQLEDKGFTAATDSITVDGERVEIFNFNTVIIGEDTQKSNISIYVGPKQAKISGNTGASQIYDISYTNWYLEMLPCGTYSLLPASIAISKIQSGEGSLVYLNEKNGDTVVPYSPRVVKKFRVLDITIAYYDASTEQDFLQPIYVITGEASFDNGVLGKFYYFVPAINYDQIADKAVEETEVIEY